MKIKSAVILASLVAMSTASLAHENDPGEQNLAGRPGDPAKITRTVRLIASEIKFDVSKLAFKTGETVKFVVINKGEQDHELTIADRAYQLDHRKDMAQMAEMPNMSGMESHHHDDGGAITVRPGETKELVWQFTRAGAFEFACNIPGHAEAGMIGTITVQ